MNEAHELVHTSIGRILCGCWGKRDFNAWGLCEGCIEQHPYALAATFAGPVFTFSMIWAGARLLSEKRTERQKAMGYALIFSNMPFARLFQPLMGGGDETWALTKLLHNHTLAQGISFSVILLITIYPLLKAYQVIEHKQKTAYFISFFLLPVLVDHVVLLGVMNGLLARGVLATDWILGSPRLVTVWTVSMVVVFLSTWKYIGTLACRRI
ncbi:hypothetical protein [Spirosoma horti]